MNKRSEIAFLKYVARSHPHLWQTSQSGLYSSSKLTIPVNKFWLKPDSWLAVSQKNVNPGRPAQALPPEA